MFQTISFEGLLIVVVLDRTRLLQIRFFFFFNGAYVEECISEIHSFAMSVFLSDVPLLH